MAKRQSNRERRAAMDDLRAGFDRDDDDLVRDALDRLSRRGGTEHTEIEAPPPRRDDEIVCRSCRLVVRGRKLGDAALLVCDDCHRG